MSRTGASCTIDVEQLPRLNAFKAQIQSEGLTGGYDSPTDLEHQLQRDLTRTIRRLAE
jgi:hypothetical protein